MICLLNSWEADDWSVNNVEPGCRNHKHIFQRRVFERFGGAQFANRIVAQIYETRDGVDVSVGYVVESAGQARWTEMLMFRKCKGKIGPASISRLLNMFQRMLDDGDQRSMIIGLQPEVAANHDVP